VPTYGPTCLSLPVPFAPMRPSASTTSERCPTLNSVPSCGASMLAPLPRRLLAKQYGFERAAVLLDLGGGSGGVAIAACQACPGLSATIVELPRVVPFAAASVAEANLSGRIRTAAVDVTATPPDGIFDVAVLRFFIQVLGKRATR
jgi:hypothetical protein